MYNLPSDFPHDPPKNYTYEVEEFDVTFYAFGVAIILNSLTTAVILHGLFGGSTTSNKDAIAPLLAPPVSEIR